MFAGKIPSTNSDTLAEPRPDLCAGRAYAAHASPVAGLRVADVKGWRVATPERCSVG